MNSSRHTEYRAACDSKFELSTVFKSAEELEVLRKDVPKADVSEDAKKAEVME